MKTHMPFPTKQEFNNISLDFFNQWQFPNCLGAIDGKHIRIKCPANSGSQYYNYKGYFSIVLQGVVDANYSFLCVDIGAYGTNSDGGTFQNTDFGSAVIEDSLLVPDEAHLPIINQKAKKVQNEKLPFVFIADDAYPLRENLLKPFPQRGLSLEERIFNYRLSRARRCVECAFGILVSKWRCLDAKLELTPQNTDFIVMACCILHNIVIREERLVYGEKAVDSFREYYLKVKQAALAAKKAEQAANNTDTTTRQQYNNPTVRAKKVRDAFKQYFVGAGNVEFQYKLCNLGSILFNQYKNSQSQRQ